MANKVIDAIAWNPDPTLCMLAVSNEDHVVLVAPDLYSRKVNEATRALLSQSAEYYGTDLQAVGADIKESVCKMGVCERQERVVGSDLAVQACNQQALLASTWRLLCNYGFEPIVYGTGRDPLFAQGVISETVRDHQGHYSVHGLSPD
jgi:hypothetical protein